MIPVGYMLKKVVQKPDWLDGINIQDIYSFSGCVSEFFADYVNFWKHNGWWLFDSPAVIQALAAEHNIDTAGHQFFYYEVYEREYDEKDKTWKEFSPEKSFVTNVQAPSEKKLEGFDVVTGRCSPLSCNGLAKDVTVNQHCLLATFEEAKAGLENGILDKGEPGPYRIFAVYSIQ